MSPHMAITQPRENCRAGSLLETLESQKREWRGGGMKRDLKKKKKKKNTGKLVALLI